MKKVLSYLIPHRKKMAIAFVIKVFGTLIELLIPFILTHILKEVVVMESVPEILKWGSLMIICAALACATNIIANRMVAAVTRRFSEKLRSDLFDKTLSLSMGQTDKFTIPSLESRITTDTYNIHNFIGMMQRMGVRAPLQLIGGIVITMIMDRYLSIVMFSLLPLIFIVTYIVSSKGVPLYTRVQSSTDKMINVVREDTQGIRVIKALSKNDYENERYDRVNKNLSRDEKIAGSVMGAVNPVMTLLMNCGITAVIALSAFRVADGLSDPETVIAFIQYFTMISMAMLGLSRIFVGYTKCSASAKRVSEVLCTVPDLPVAEKSEVRDADFIEFRKVSFSYNGKHDHLTDISFSLQKGGRLGIIGATGSGKTTVIRLLMRFFDPQSGEILIDGKNIKEYSESELSKKFGVALQNDFLYMDSIRENIDFGRGLSESDIENAAAISQSQEFINSKEGKLDYMLSQKGSNLSGGQKQRLLIARAVAAKPEILILDDSSSALDYRTDARLRAALKEGMKESTVITVAQRVSSVKDSDLIIVLEGGRIIGIDTHEELMKSCPEYKEISDSQMGGAFID